MNNIVNLYKPVGPSSFFMVQSVKRALKIKKAGHIGTLDPKAEGVLPICLNRSTRLIQFLVSLPKVYRANMTLGIATDTQDATGQVTATGDATAATAGFGDNNTATATGDDAFAFAGGGDNNPATATGACTALAFGDDQTDSCTP